MIQVPKFSDFRRAVDSVPYRRDSVIIKLLYLGCARCSEICSYVQPVEEKMGARALGKYLTWELDKFHVDDKYEPVLLLHIACGKRKKKTTRKDASEEDQLFIKTVAVPVNPQYEPWTIDLLEWIKKQKESHEALQFHMTRQNVYRIVREHLNTHPHALRHYRASHLFSHYNFTPQELLLYGGWTFKSTFQGLGSSMLDVYVHSSWTSYFPKLLTPLT